MNTRICVMAAIFAVAFSAHDAMALEYKHDNFSVKLTGYGDAGLIEPEFDAPLFVGDWRARAQANYAVSAGQKIGLVYSIDAQTVDSDEYIDDLFMLYENRDYGRVELGMTESIAGKLGLGLPDVGGLRINNNPLFYKKISPDGAVIPDTTLDSGDRSLRLNLVSVPNAPMQYGVSVAGGASEYKFALDAGIKYRHSTGKVKTAFALGASYMDSPDGFNADAYAPHITADWRGQLATSLNIQYNSWIWATSARLIYDKNPVGNPADGVVAGTGLSYDLLKYSISLSYVFSETGIWDNDIKNYSDHTVIASLRYKYSQNVSGWMSLGMTTKTPFAAAGMRLTF